jgi:hypothetical protein
MESWEPTQQQFLFLKQVTYKASGILFKGGTEQCYESCNYLDGSTITITRNLQTQWRDSNVSVKKPT